MTFRKLGIQLGIIWSIYLFELAGFTNPPISISYIGTLALGLIIGLHSCLYVLKDYDVTEKGDDK